MDLSVLLTLVPVEYAAYVGFALFVIAHGISSGVIPAPKPGATGVWAKVYPILNATSANYGRAANKPKE